VTTPYQGPQGQAIAVREISEEEAERELAAVYRDAAAVKDLLKRRADRREELLGRFAALDKTIASAIASSRTQLTSCLHRGFSSPSTPYGPSTLM
jgi:hypothetical protein